MLLSTILWIWFLALLLLVLWVWYRSRKEPDDYDSDDYY